METRIVFMGSPDFAIPTLKALASNFTVAGVVTQPDRPAGRGRQFKPPAVKALAEEMDLPLIQPVSLRKQPEALEHIQAWRPDVIVVAAFGQILKSDVLEMPPHGCINVHASLLPSWRGASPINAAILNGDRLTGVTIMKMDEGLDTGPILGQSAIPIGESDTAGALSIKLAELGAVLLIETLVDYLEGRVQPTPQDEGNASYAPMLKKSDGALDFNLPAEVLARKVRAFDPWPGTFTDLGSGRLKILRASSLPPGEVDDLPPPGEPTVYQGLPAIGSGYGLLILEELQPAGKRALGGKAFLAGARDWMG